LTSPSVAHKENIKEAQVSHSNLNNEVPNVFLELWYILVEAYQAFDEHFNLSTTTSSPAHQKYS